MLNSGEAIAGYYYDASRFVHGFVMSAGGKTKTFDPTGSTYTRPQAIAAGVAAGYYNGASNARTASCEAGKSYSALSLRRRF